MLKPDELLPVALEALDQACRLVRTQQPGRVVAKSERDPVSELDVAVERHVRAFLANQTPSIGFLGEEEGGRLNGRKYTWALDPIDGTVNFVRGMPLCGVSLALVHHTQPILGAIALPFLGARYWAVRGEGAFRDGRRLRVAETTSLDQAIIAIGDFAVGEHAEERNRLRFGVANGLASHALRVRMVGSAAIDLAWLAEGRLDASITFSNQPWDVAAGVVVAREAGARVVDMDGSEYGTRSRAVLAASPTLANDMVSIVQHASIVADRAARRAEWARRSTASPPPTPPSPTQRTSRRPASPDR